MIYWKIAKGIDSLRKKPVMKERGGAHPCRSFGNIRSKKIFRGKVRSAVDYAPDMAYNDIALYTGAGSKEILI